GGVIGNFAELGASDGHVTLNRLGRSHDIHQPSGGWHIDDAPDYLNRYSPFSPEDYFQNSTASPDFPTAARVIRQLYHQSGGPVVDGVISLDPIGLAAILGAIGPVKVPSWPEPLTGDNAAQVLLHDQYKTYDTPERIDFLGEVTDQVWIRLTTGNYSLPRLAHAVSSALTDTHVMVVSLHDEEAKALTGLGTSGEVPPVRGDFLGVVTQNAGGNKIDYFLRRSVKYQTTIDPERHTLTGS